MTRQRLNTLPQTCDVRRLGLDPERIGDTTLIHRKHGGRLYRVEYEQRSFVLKWFSDPAEAIEVRSYGLLEEHGVPTLPVHARTENALLLEDLSASPTWRAATESDVEHAATGSAIAEWYLALHAAGREIVHRPSGPPTFLKREADVLDAETILTTGEKLGLGDHPVWRLAADHIEMLKKAMRSLTETLNYNDFHWSNLALSRDGRLSIRAIVYDYHLLGIGPRYSDCRNVAGSLGSRAAAAFWEKYGTVDEREAILDAPIAELHSLSVAVSRSPLPEWAQGGLRKVRSGELEEHLRLALGIL